MKNKYFIILIGIILVLLIFVVILVLNNSGVMGPATLRRDNLVQKVQPTINSNTNLSVNNEKELPVKDFSVSLRENPQDKKATDIYIKDNQTKEESFFITLQDAERDHYHAYEVHNGNIYIVRRIGYSGYPDPDWTDELWRYSLSGGQKKIYSLQGLDFRVSSDEKIIAVFGDNLDLLDYEGNLIKTFLGSEVVVDKDIVSGWWRVIELNSGVIWLDNTFGPNLAGIVRIDLPSFLITKYTVSGGREYELNFNKNLVAYSTYPAMFDVEGREDFENAKTPVDLLIYNLNTQSSKIIASSTAERFNPAWIDADTLEYDDPSTSTRIKYKIE